MHRKELRLRETVFWAKAFIHTDEHEQPTTAGASAHQLPFVDCATFDVTPDQPRLHIKRRPKLFAIRIKLIYGQQQ